MARRAGGRDSPPARLASNPGKEKSHAPLSPFAAAEFFRLIERFNRTVQEEFTDYHYDLLFLDDLTEFNLEMLRWRFWYNLVRPH